MGRVSYSNGPKTKHVENFGLLSSHYSVETIYNEYNEYSPTKGKIFTSENLMAKKQFSAWVNHLPPIFGLTHGIQEGKRPCTMNLTNIKNMIARK